MIARLLVLPLLAALPLAAAAELASVSAGGFTSTHRRDVQATPARAFEAVGQVERWWDARHSYSGQASNLRLGLKAGDCFCEQWDGGSVEHARVVNVRQGSMVRLEGALGPLQEMAVNGVLTFSTGTVEGRTYAQLRYVVRGAPETALGKLAAVVDRVIGEQFGRWAAFVETRQP